MPAQHSRSPLVSRRTFLAIVPLTGLAATLVGCANPAATPQSTTTAPPKAPETAATKAPVSAPTTAAAATTQAPAVTATAASPRRGGTFTFARSTAITEFSPFKTDNGHIPFHEAMYNRLAHYDQNMVLQPELAEKLDISADGKTITIKLREGVKFHSGRELTADDVKFTLQFASEQAIVMAPVYKAATVETPSKYTMVLKFDKVNVSVYDLVDTLYIIDKETIDKRANMAIGTGPFKLEKYTPNDRVEMVAFKDYWDKGKPYLDKYVLKQVPDTAARVIELEVGASDSVWEPAFHDAVRLRDTGKYVVDMGTPGASIFHATMNTKIEPFTNKKVRQAIAWSLNRQRFCETILSNLVKPTCLMWPPHSWAYFPDLEGKIGYDLDKARALLKEAGLEKGFETEIMTSSKLGAARGSLAEILQSDLAKLGIKARISDVEGAIFQNRNMKERDAAIMIHAYGRGNRDPGTLVTGASFWLSDKEGGPSRIDSAEYDRLREEQQSTLDRDTRKAVCRKIQELVLDECFVNPIALSPRLFVYAKYVRGFGYGFDDSLRVGDMWLDK